MFLTQGVNEDMLVRLFRRLPGMEYCDLKKDRATGRSKVNSREYKSAETTKLSCRYVCSDAHIAISAVIRVPSANAALFSSNAPILG